MFSWTYLQFGSNFVYNEEWEKLRFFQFYKRDDWLKKYGDQHGDDYTIPEYNYSLGYFVGLWSRFAEIGVRTAFIVFASTASCLFDNLESEITSIMAQKRITDKNIDNESAKLENWKNQYDLVCRFVEQINRVFGFFLLIISIHDFANCILDFANILQHLDLKESLREILAHADNIARSSRRELEISKNSIDIIRDPYHIYDDTFIHMKSDPIKTCQFLHPLVRFLLLLVVSHSVGVKVLLII